MPQKIDNKHVRHIARLGRVELADEQVEMFGRQLSDILDYVGKLQELNTDGIEPMAHAVELRNILADDVPGQSLTPDQALANAPRREGDFFAVPKVIDDGQ